MAANYTLKELAEIVAGTLRGSGDGIVTGVADLADASADDAAWLTSSKYATKLAASRAGVVLVPAGFGETPMPAILCERVDRSVAALLGAFAPTLPAREPGVHPSAVVHDTASVDASAVVGPHAVVDAEARIGAGSVLHAGAFVGRGTVLGEGCVLWQHAVVRERCKLGDRVVVHANAVVGADGFGYYFDEGRHVPVPHIGGVILEDDVEIGACSCVDRSKFGYTVVGLGTKIDNMVQIAHNVQIGRHSVLTAQVGISGSVRIGDYCILGGRSGAADNVTIGSGAKLAAQAVADKDIADGLTVSGFPAQPHQRELRERATVRRMAGVARQLKDLISRVNRLEAPADDKP